MYKIINLFLCCLIITGCVSNLSEKFEKEVIQKMLIGEKRDSFFNSHKGIFLNDLAVNTVVLIHSSGKADYQKLLNACNHGTCFPGNLVETLPLIINGSYKFFDINAENYTHVKYPKVCFLFSVFFNESNIVVGWSYVKNANWRCK